MATCICCVFGNHVQQKGSHGTRARTGGSAAIQDSSAVCHRHSRRAVRDRNKVPSVIKQQNQPLRRAQLPETYLDVVEGRHCVINLLDALLQGLPSPEDSSIILHHTLQHSSKATTAAAGTTGVQRPMSAAGPGLQTPQNHDVPSTGNQTHFTPQSMYTHTPSA